MNILGRFTVRWLVGLIAVLTVLSHVSDAGRIARLGPPQGLAVASSSGEFHPGLAGDAPSGEIRFRPLDRQPLLPDPSGDAVLSSAVSATAPSPFALVDIRLEAANARHRAYAPGQRAPPLLLKA